MGILGLWTMSFYPPNMTNTNNPVRANTQVRPYMPVLCVLCAFFAYFAVKNFFGIKCFHVVVVNVGAACVCALFAVTCDYIRQLQGMAIIPLFLFIRILKAFPIPAEKCRNRLLYPSAVKASALLCR
jgi:hypothetical protein